MFRWFVPDRLRHVTQVTQVTQVRQVTQSDLCRFSKGHGLRIGAGEGLLDCYCAVPVLVGDQVNPEFL